MVSPDVQATVTLTDDELERMRAFSERIHSSNRRRKRKHRQGWKPRGREAVDARYLGYCAEFAFAKFLGVEWREFGVEADHWRARPDVAGYDVKSTSLMTGKLIVTPLDADDARCVLVVCYAPTFGIAGWYRAGDAKTHAEWWNVERAKGGAWYVPRVFLKPVPAFVVPVDPSPAVDIANDARAKILDDEALAYERTIVERINTTPTTIDRAAARGDWRAALIAAGVEPPARETAAQRDRRELAWLDSRCTRLGRDDDGIPRCHGDKWHVGPCIPSQLDAGGT